MLQSAPEHAIFIQKTEKFCGEGARPQEKFSIFLMKMACSGALWSMVGAGGGHPSGTYPHRHLNPRPWPP